VNDWKEYKETCYDFMNLKGEDTCFRNESHMKKCSFENCQGYNKRKTVVPTLKEWRCSSYVVLGAGSECTFSDTFVNNKNLSGIIFHLIDDNRSSIKRLNIKQVRHV